MRAIALLLFLAACGDNIKPDASPDARTTPPVDPGVDHGIAPEPDGVMPGEDMLVEPGEDPLGHCLFGMQHGKVPHDCLPPSGRCAEYSFCGWGLCTSYIVCKGN